MMAFTPQKTPVRRDEGAGPRAVSKHMPERGANSGLSIVISHLYINVSLWKMVQYLVFFVSEKSGNLMWQNLSALSERTEILKP